MPRAQYATVKIPAELAKTLDSAAEALGYRTRAEIVDDAIRMYIFRMKEFRQAETESRGSSAARTAYPPRRAPV